MAACDVCTFLFNNSTRLPLFLPCAHTFCRSCVIQISVSGQFECPVDQMTIPMADVSTLPLNRIILSQLDSVKVKCSATAADDATRFCKVHFRMLCDTCACAVDRGCEFLDIEEFSDIKHIVVNEIEKCPKERLSPQQRYCLTRPMSLKLDELMTLLAAATNEATQSLTCSGCGGSIRFLDRNNVELYCDVCANMLKERDSELAANFLPYVEDSDIMRNSLRTAVQQRLHTVDFHSLSQEQTQWLRNNNMPFRTFYRVAKELANRSLSDQASGKPLPDTFHCPRCSNPMSNQEYVLRRLPCRFAFHAICNCCAQGLASKASIQCPMDGSCFYTSTLDLPEVRKDSQQCMKCLASSYEFVNLSDMCLYCAKCYQNSANTDPTTQFVPFDEECRQHIFGVVLVKLQKIDFCELNSSHYQWMFYQTADLLEFFSVAKEIINLKNNQRRTEDNLPESFICPGCREVFTQFEHQFRRLPCSDAFHALCETCLQTSCADITCPLDLQKYHTSYKDLPVFQKTNYSRNALKKEPENGEKPSSPETDPIRPIDPPIIRIKQRHSHSALSTAAG